MPHTFKLSERFIKMCQRDIMSLTPAEMALMTPEEISAYNKKFLA